MKMQRASEAMDALPGTLRWFRPVFLGFWGLGVKGLGYWVCVWGFEILGLRV